MYRHILIASDGSELAGKGLDAGLALAAALGARATLVTVSDPWQAIMAAEPSAVALGAEVREEQRREHRAHAQTVIDDAQARAARAGVALDAIYVPERLPDEAILETADSCGADLIVMGAFGRSRLREAMIGSTTGTLLTRSAVSLLVSH